MSYQTCISHMRGVMNWSVHDTSELVCTHVHKHMLSDWLFSSFKKERNFGVFDWNLLKAFLKKREKTFSLCNRRHRDFAPFIVFHEKKKGERKRGGGWGETPLLRIATKHSNYHKQAKMVPTNIHGQTEKEWINIYNAVLKAQGFQSRMIFISWPIMIRACMYERYNHAPKGQIDKKILT